MTMQTFITLLVSIGFFSFGAFVLWLAFKIAQNAKTIFGYLFAFILADLSFEITGAVLSYLWEYFK